MATARISTSQVYENAHSHIAKARAKHAESSEKAGTQKNISRPSDDPAGWMQMNSLKDDNSARQSMVKNATMANQVLSLTEGIFEQVQNSLGRAYELAIGQADTARSTTETRESTYREVKNLFEAMIQSLNFRYGERTLLAGYKSQGPAFDTQGNFLGDSGTIEVEVQQGHKLPININAENIVLGKGVLGSVNILGAMKTFMQGLETDSDEMIQTSLDALKQGIEQMSYVRAEIGARMSGLDAILSKHSASEAQMRDSISKIEDVDAIKVFSDLARDQTILQAAVSTTQKILADQPFETLLK